jgi:hypothetical protein
MARLIPKHFHSENVDKWRQSRELPILRSSGREVVTRAGAEGSAPAEMMASKNLSENLNKKAVQVAGCDELTLGIRIEVL